MTTILRTPKSWPSILLARAGAKDPTDLDAAVKAGAFAGLRTALHDLARTLPPFRQEAIYRYMLHLDTSVKASIADPDDQLEALQQDQQGLGPSRQQQPGQAE